MADYFILGSDKRLSNLVEIKGINKVIDANYIKTNQIQFLDSNPIMLYIEGTSIYPDFIESTIPLISNELWTIFNGMNLKNVFYKPICLADVKKMSQVIYWIIIPPKIDCLSDESEFNRDGSIKTLKIEKEKIGNYKIFKIHGVQEDLIVIHKDIVNAMATNTCGCSFTKII